jgi:subfamily B ATP-binding cassette protein MsbA
VGIHAIRRRAPSGAHTVSDMGALHLRLHELLRPYRNLCALALFAMLVESAADLLEPWPLKVVLDYVIGSKTPTPWLAAWMAGPHGRLTLLNLAAVAVVTIALVGAVSSYTEKYLSTTIGKRVGYDLRHALYHHVQRLSLSFYEHRQTGDMVVRLTADINAIEDFITGSVLGIVLDVATLAGMLAVMFYLDWRFALIGLSIAPVLFAIVFHFVHRIKEASREVKRKESELASVVQESIASARVVKAFATEEFEEDRLDRESLASVDATLRARSVKARLAPLVDLVVALGTCLVLYFGVRFVLSGRISAGALVVYVLYLTKMFKPIKDLSKTADSFSKAAVAFDRIGELLSVERQVTDQPGARPAHHFEGRIAFHHVAFGYRASDLVLREVNLYVEPYQRAALVGATGSGKSTLIALIPRLYDVLAGEVRVDGSDVRGYTLQSLREQVSFVLQDPVLFRGSIAHNIAYGRPGASHEEILRASQLAQAHEFITRMPHGYDTVIGERGDTLSGGQRQRIAIARALIRDTPILLLDEPSAALDPESEELMFKGLARLLEGRTSITIAHRLATVRRADVIFVLERGVIVETGTHDELLARDGPYARFYRIQFRSEARPRSVAM